MHLFLNKSRFGRCILVENIFSVALGWPSSLSFCRTAFAHDETLTKLIDVNSRA